MVEQVLKDSLIKIMHPTFIHTLTCDVRCLRICLRCPGIPNLKVRAAMLQVPLYSIEI